MHIIWRILPWASLAIIYFHSILSFIYSFYIRVIVASLLSFWSYSPSLVFVSSQPLLLREDEPPLSHPPQHIKSYQDWVHPLPCGLVWWPCQGKMMKKQATVSVLDSAPFPLLGFLYEDWAAHWLHLCKGPRSNPCMVLGWCFSLYRPPWALVI